MRANRLVIGTAQFGMEYGMTNNSGKPRHSEISSILSTATKSGISMLDTAAAYGSSEEAIGLMSNCKTFEVVTKIPPIPNECDDVEKWIKGIFGRSLLRLKQEKVYGLLLHRASDLATSKGAKVLRVLESLKSQRLVDKIGVSIYDPAEINLISDLKRIDLVQAPLNVFDRRLIDTNALNLLKSYNIEIHSRSVFLQGILLCSIDNIPLKFKKWEQIFRKWHQLLNQEGCSALAACLSIPFSYKGIDKIIVGVDSTKHLQEILRECESVVSATAFSKLKSIDPLLINPFNWTSL